MSRKPTDTTHISLRIRESLRRRLEREAEKHRTSLNTMIRLKLEDSFAEQDRKDHGEHNRDMEVLLARYSKHLTLYDLQQDLMRALDKTTDTEVAKLWRVISGTKKSGGVS
ncbi:MAG TPA: toxin-antitoxin system HicB family antitoxin [Gemmataceae bacterium]|nr:toxin-antitoxin system HicB family antitoxin [Gemmataceae bacterium]